jgi:nitrogen-specific signal transduction histidine kinase
MSESESSVSLEEVRDAVSSVYHDLNNPLSIISGNAQFLLELSREADLDEQFVSSVQDIQEAAQRVSSSLDRLTRLKEELEGHAQQ